MAASMNDEHNERSLGHQIAESRLDSTRNELRRMMKQSEAHRNRHGFFPRSKTMRAMTGGKLPLLLAIGAGGLLLLRPGVLKAAIRILPVQAIVKTLAVKYLARGR